MKAIIRLVVFCFSLLSFTVNAQTYVLYGMTYGGGANHAGTIFSYTPSTGKDSVLYSFNTTFPGPYYPAGNFIQASNGLLYGTTNSGGTYGRGALFSYNPNTNQVLAVINFTDTVGADPYSIIQASDGNIYGMSRNKTGDPVLCRYDIVSHKDSGVVVFTGYDEEGMVIDGSDSLLYGVKGYNNGTIDSGDIYSYNIYTKQYTTVFGFKDIQPADLNGMAQPFSLIQGANHILYGNTWSGLNYHTGDLFKYNLLTNTDSILHPFDTSTHLLGIYPLEYTVQASKYIYGETQSGGSNNNGVLYRCDVINGQDTVLISFGAAKGTDQEGFVRDTINNLFYGLVNDGGPNAGDSGTIYSFDSIGQYTVLFNFNASNTAKGEHPIGTLTPVNMTIVPTGTSEIIENKTMKIYPNPSNGFVTLTYELNTGGNVQISIINELGQVVYYNQEYKSASTVNEQLNLQNIASGIYSLRIQTNDGIIVRRLVMIKNK